MHIDKALAIASLSLLPLSLAVPADARDVAVKLQYGTRQRPFERRQFQTMRALAHHLDERAQHAAQLAAEESQRGPNRGGRFLESVTRFAERAHDFHERMDNYEAQPWEVPREVQQLNAEARAARNRLRRNRIFRGTWHDWDGVLDVLALMNRVMAGQNVSVPPPHRLGWGDEERDYEPWKHGRRDDRDDVPDRPR